MMIGNMANIIFAVIGAIIITGVLVRYLKMFLSKEKSVKAKVTDKQKYEQRVATKMQAPYTKNKYIINDISLVSYFIICIKYCSGLDFYNLKLACGMDGVTAA